jgi:hypothetical protein
VAGSNAREVEPAHRDGIRRLFQRRNMITLATLEPNTTNLTGYPAVFDEERSSDENT